MNSWYQIILSSLAVSETAVNIFLFLEERHGVLKYPRLVSQVSTYTSAFCLSQLFA